MFVCLVRVCNLSCFETRSKNMITPNRETVIDFSMDFMELGISVMIKKPQIEMPGAFSFAKPMQSSVWLAALGSLITVSIVLFFVQRKSHIHKPIYSFQNTLWFTISSIFRQGAHGVTPR